MSKSPRYYTDVASCVEETLRSVGRRIHLGAPLGLGKANQLVNEFYRWAREDPRIELRIFTALTLGHPRWKSELERRFVEPLSERLFGTYPELDYVDALRRGDLPQNIHVGVLLSTEELPGYPSRPAVVHQQQLHARRSRSPRGRDQRDRPARGSRGRGRLHALQPELQPRPDPRHGAAPARQGVEWW
jgi:hypothetical protein